jgi:GNAT superfamily N-acetyltransferase
VTELTTGWEADIPIADSLLRQFVHSCADRTAEMAVAVGGRGHHDADAAFADLRSPFLFHNAVVLLRPPTRESLAATVDSALRFYPPHRAFVLLSVFPVPGAAFAERGLALMGHPLLMVMPFNATRGPLPPGLVEVDWVATAPSARGHGYGTALTWAAIDAAPGLPAVLIASDDGRPVYDKMGFLRLMRLSMYVRAGGAR